MTKKYTRLSHFECIEIYKLLALKKSLSQIAATLGRHKSTICREVKQFGKDTYHHQQGEWKAVYNGSNRRSQKTKMSQHPELEKYVLEKLQKKWSPDQISVSLRKEFPNQNNMQLSHETIYLYIYLHSKKELKDLLITELRQQRKFRGNVRRELTKELPLPTLFALMNARKK